MDRLVDKITDVLTRVMDVSDASAIAARAQVIASTGAYRLAGDDLALANRQAIKVLRDLGSFDGFVRAAADQIASKHEHPAMRTHAHLQAMGYASIDDALSVDQAAASGAVCL